jgi:NAD(P)-dependent dehydrogenase (short-subunit alcohol dehydrogenase family)
MDLKPKFMAEHYKGSGKLEGQVAIVTGGDSGIGRAVAVLFAREGADVAILYLNEHEDAAETQRCIEAEGPALRDRRRRRQGHGILPAGGRPDRRQVGPPGRAGE